MDIEEFEACLEKIITETAPVSGSDIAAHDVKVRETLFDALEQKLRQAERDGKETEPFLHVLNTIRRSLCDFDFMDDLAVSDDKEPEIFAAIASSNVSAVKAALKNWDVNAGIGRYGRTALYSAMSLSWSGSIEIINLLLDEGADPQQGLRDTNVLHGLMFGNFDKSLTTEDLLPVVLRCVALGADIEQRTAKLGWTPLIGAVSEWNPIATEVLLLAGADISVKADEHEGAFLSGAGIMDFAEGCPETVALLEVFLARQ